MRPIWSGSISFGLVNIPIKLYSATQEHQLSFDMLHKKDLSPIRFGRICKAEEKEVEWKDIVKGYEFQPGEYVVITNEDFERANPKENKMIQIIDFVAEDEIDSVYCENPYYLEPAGKGTDLAYGLLREALTKSKKVGIAKFVLRNREHLGIVKPFKNLLIINQMRFDSELRKSEELKSPESKIKSVKELDMAIKLINQMSVKFKPEKYKDTYTADLRNVIDQKLKGTKPKTKPKAPKSSKVTDIMGLLKASLDDAPHYKKTGS